MTTISVVTATEMMNRFMKQKKHIINHDQKFYMLEYCGQTMVFNELPDMENSVWCVMVNSDGIEGRGPMKLKKIFRTVEGAIDYVMRQRGMGNKQGSYVRCGVNVYDELYAYSEFDMYDIEPKILE